MTRARRGSFAAIGGLCLCFVCVLLGGAMVGEGLLGGYGSASDGPLESGVNTGVVAVGVASSLSPGRR